MKSLNMIFFLLSGGVSLLFGLAWWNNVYLSFYKLTWMNQDGGKVIIQGMFPFLDIFCVDHSTVTTFIPFMGFICITFGLYSFIRQAPARETYVMQEEFPFFKGYNELIVALGLMGTVWGLIMIGFLPNAENLKIQDLIGALRTALFSTLTALFWVYIVVLRIIRPLGILLARKINGKGTGAGTIQDLEKLVKEFTQNLRTLTKVVREWSRDIEQLKSELVPGTVKEIKDNIKKSEASLSLIQKDLSKSVLAQTELFSKILEKLESGNKKSGSILEIMKHESAKDDRRKKALVNSLADILKN